MATFSISNWDQGKFLELHLIAWNEAYVPNLSIAIRGRSASKSEAMCLVPIYNINNLVQNLKDPATSAQLQMTNNSGGSTVVGRYGDDFTIQNNFGSSAVTLNAQQWADTIVYIEQTASRASFIREISKNVRMQVINVARQLGLDKVVNGRFMTTQWYDNSMDDPMKFQAYHNSGGQRQSYRNENQVNQNTSRDGVSSGWARTNGQAPVASNPMSANHPATPNPAGRTPIGMPPNTAMPPIPSTVNTQQMVTKQAEPSAPVAGVATGPDFGKALPPIPNGSPLTTGLRTAMDTMFD